MHRKVRLGLVRFDHEEVDQHAWNLHLLGRQRAAQRHPLDLYDDDAAGAPRRLRHRDHFAEDRFVLHRHIAVFVGSGAAQQRDVDVKRLEEQAFTAVNIDQFDQILLGHLALSAAAVTRINECPQAHMGYQTGPAGRHLARQLRQTTLRQGIGLDLIGGRHTLDRRRVDQGAANHTLQESRMSKMRDAAIGAVAQSNRMHGGQASRLALDMEALSDRGDQRVRHRMASSRTADQQSVAAFNQPCGFIRRDDPHRHLTLPPSSRRTTLDATRRRCERPRQPIQPSAEATRSGEMPPIGARQLCKYPVSYMRFSLLMSTFLTKRGRRLSAARNAPRVIPDLRSATSTSP